MQYIEQSEALTGYKAKIMHRPTFKVTGFTLLVQPNSDQQIGQFWQQIMTDGRLEKLRAASSVRSWVLGLGSWDPQCERKGGSRYTICIEETKHTDFSELALDYPLFTKEIDETDWLCFEMTESKFFERFWQDDPYKMLQQLGYKFHTGNFNLGLHFEAYSREIDDDSRTNPDMEFWITVKK
jgi:predicted transcriptional regulator YdeE